MVLSLHANCCRFTITLMNSTTKEMPFKMKLNNDRPETVFCYETDNIEYGCHGNSTFPFPAYQQAKVELTVHTATLQVLIYYTYITRLSDWRSRNKLASHRYDPGLIPASACEIVMWSSSQTGVFSSGTPVSFHTKAIGRKHRCQRA